MAGSTIAVKVVGDISNLSRDLSRAETKVEKFAKVAGKLKLPIIAAGAASFKLASDFDSSMSKITGLVGIAEEKVDAMGESVRGLAGETAKSPTELAEALFFVTSAGLRGDEALQALEVSAKASAAGLGETAVVADAVTSAMNAYAASGLTATESTDILVATVREGKLSAEELASSIGAVLPIASAMGVEFDEVGASIAAMTRLGLNSAESVTALRALFSTIQKPGAQAKTALDNVGLSAELLRTTLREDGLLAVLQLLKEKFKGNDDELVKVIPNVKALTGFLSLTGDAAEDTAGIFDRMEDTTGALDTAFDSASDTIEFRFNKAMAEAKELALGVRDPLTRFAGQFLPALSAAMGNLSHEAALTERAINAVSDGVISGRNPVDAFAKAIAFTGGAALSSNETLYRLIDGLGLTSESFDAIIKDTDGFAKAAGLNRKELDLLIGVANILRTREVDPLSVAMSEGADKVLLMKAAVSEVGDSASDASGGVADLNTELEILLGLAEEDFSVNITGKFGFSGGSASDFEGNPQTPIVPGSTHIQFHEGGIVPGVPGSNVPIIAQAGETVTRRSETSGNNGHGGGGQVLQNVYVTNPSPTLIDELIETNRRQ